jgi:hypothetical protein
MWCSGRSRASTTSSCDARSPRPGRLPGTPATWTYCES